MRQIASIGREGNGSADGVLPPGRRFLEPALLLLLREREAHGYSLLEELPGLGIEVRDSGTLYRALRRLEGSSLVRSRWLRPASGPARRVYRITPEGEAELHRRQREVRRHAELVNGWLRRYETAPAAIAADGAGDPIGGGYGDTGPRVASM